MVNVPKEVKRAIKTLALENGMKDYELVSHAIATYAAMKGTQILADAGINLVPIPEGVKRPPVVKAEDE